MNIQVKYAIISYLSLALGIPAKAIVVPGTNPDGFVNHLLRLPGVHFNVALLDKAAEYEKASLEAMLVPTMAPNAGPVELAYMLLHSVDSLGIYTYR